MSSKTKRILIVDDDEGILEALKETVSMMGYEVETRTKGAGMIEFIVEYKPDVIILDLLLAGESGEEIVGKLKKDEKTKAIPVVLFSAFPDADKLAQKCGADGFLAKPFNVIDLLDTIERYVSV